MILTHFIAFLGQVAGAVLPTLGLRSGGTAIGFYPVKSPNSVRDHAVQWTLDVDETITDSAWSVEPVEAGGLAVVAGSAAIDGNITGCQIAGGVFRRVYTLINTVTTSRGQVLVESATLRIGLVEMG